MLFKDRLPNPVTPFAVIGDEPLSSTELSRQFLQLIKQLGIPQSP
jgi:hypothetical protein